MMKNTKRFIKIGLLTFVITFVVMSVCSFAYAADGGQSSDIFTTLQKKLYETLKDLRKIVYVISGFGLVVFSVAAIFNKISYKHLGYIMIGLSLLSLMFPFLEYFSGYSVEEVEQKQLTFKNYLAASDYDRIRGELESDVLDGNAEGQEELSQEELERRREEAEKLALGKIDSAELTGGVTGGEENGLAGANPNQKKLEQAQAITEAGCSVVTMKGEWTENGTRTVCSVDSDGRVQTATETCTGHLKDGTCKKTAGQVFNDIWKTGQDVIQAGIGAASAWNSAKNAYKDTVTGINNIGDIFNSDMGFIDKLFEVSNKFSGSFGASGKVTYDIESILQGARNMTGSAGEIGSTWASNPESNADGNNPFSTFMALLSSYGQTAQNGIVDAASNVDTVTDYGADIHTQANNINVILTLFGLQ